MAIAYKDSDNEDAAYDGPSYKDRSSAYNSQFDEPKDKPQPLLWIVVTTYANDENDEATGGHPYAIYAENKEEAIEKAKAIALQEEIQTQDEWNKRYAPYVPRGFYENLAWDKDNPESPRFISITWEGLNYENSGEDSGIIISEPRLLTELIKESQK